MSKSMKTEVVSVLYNRERELEARVVVCDQRFFVDFYKNGAIIDSREVAGHSIQYLEDMAENYVNGLLRIDNEKMEI